MIKTNYHKISFQDQRISHDLQKGMIIHDTERDAGIFSLAIQKINLNHSGEYTCRADNKVGMRTSNTRTLNIKRKDVQYLRKQQYNFY